MNYCTNCGAQLKTGQTRCEACGLETTERQKQRVCLNCGAPAAEHARTCMMCGNPIDDLPPQATSFSASWPGLGLGLLLIFGLVYGFFALKPATSGGMSVTETPTRTATFLPPTQTATPTQTPTPIPVPTATDTPTSTPAPLLHTIKTGETLLFIADKYNVTVEDIEAANDITAETILRVGQELVIPFATQTGLVSADARERPVIRYTVKSGDTLSGIAFEYDTSIAAIELANPGLDLDLLSVGQELIVPLQPPTFTPTPTITPTPTFTPGPPFAAPQLLYPADDALVEGDASSVLLSWTTTGLLDKQTFYVVYLIDEQGAERTYYTQATSYRLSPQDKPAQLTEYTWYVVVMRKIGIDEHNIFIGAALSRPSPSRTFRWR